MAKQTKERPKGNSHVHQITTYPITFAEVLTKITITPETPSGFLSEMSKYELNVQVLFSNRNWSPNPHMESYQKRMAQRKHDRGLE